MSKVKEWTDLFSSWEKEEQAQVEGKQAQAERMLKARWYIYNLKQTNDEKVDYETYKIYDTYAEKENKNVLDMTEEDKSKSVAKSDAKAGADQERRAAAVGSS